MTDKDTVHLQNQSAEISCDLPLLSGTIGPDVVDIRSFYQNTGLFTYDPGFTSTASCSSKITYIDGDHCRSGGRIVGVLSS